jgi:hypothetical protein
MQDRRTHTSMFRVLLVITTFGLALFHAEPSCAQGPVIFTIETSAPNDTLVAGQPAQIRFLIDPNGLPVSGLSFALNYTFSNGNIIGPLMRDSSVIRSTESASFEVFLWNVAHEMATDPDTTSCGFIDFDPTPDSGARLLWTIDFVPSDSGTILIDSVFVPPGNHLGASSPSTDPDTPISWTPKLITVVSSCPGIVTGDINADSLITPGDLILLVNRVFKGAGAFSPCDAVADVNCSGLLTPSDLVELVNFIFKGGAAPCNVCPLIESGLWNCP